MECVHTRRSLSTWKLVRSNFYRTTKTDMCVPSVSLE
jgi:hypothetical protein